MNMFCDADVLILLILRFALLHMSITALCYFVYELFLSIIRYVGGTCPEGG